MLFGRTRQENPNLELSFSDHLEELRSRLMWSVLAIIVFAFASFAYAREIIIFLMGPLKIATTGLALRPELHYTSITEPLFQSFKIALFAGLCLSFPFWIWQIWLFVAPGLFEKEKRLVTPIIMSASGLFLIGAAFAYYLAVPTAYRFLLVYASPSQGNAKLLNEKEGVSFEWIPVKRAPQKHVKNAPSSRKVVRKSPPSPSGSNLAGFAKDTPKALQIGLNGKKQAHGGMQWRFHIPASFLRNPQKWIETFKQQKEVRLLLRQGGLEQQFKLRFTWPQPKASELGDLKPILTLQAYLSVSSWFLFGFGLVFQTPLVIFLLVFVGIVTPEFLARYRRHAFVGILAISSVLTPTGDPLNLMMMAIPMYVLFEIGLLVSRLLLKNHVVDKEKPPEPPSDPGSGGSGSGFSPPPDDEPPEAGAASVEEHTLDSYSRAEILALSASDPDDPGVETSEIPPEYLDPLTEQLPVVEEQPVVEADLPAGEEIEITPPPEGADAPDHYSPEGFLEGSQEEYAGTEKEDVENDFTDEEGEEEDEDEDSPQATDLSSSILPPSTKSDEHQDTTEEEHVQETEKTPFLRRAALPQIRPPAEETVSHQPVRPAFEFKVEESTEESSAQSSKEQESPDEPEKQDPTRGQEPPLLESEESDKEDDVVPASTPAKEK